MAHCFDSTGPQMSNLLHALLAKGRSYSVNKKILIDAIGILLIALVVVVGYKLSPILLPKADLTVQPEAACDLNHQACAANLPGGGRVELSSSVRPVPMVKPFQVQVTVSGLTPARVEVDFAGIDMQMGLNRPLLQDQGGGRYVAEVSLPVCITGQMDWQVTVLIESGNQRIAIPYRLPGGAVRHV
ncbi:MAG: hypothetical protein H6R15_1093 [Proteobacteria bacterium]|nr:hypothetical protein [Pseudomonadota bacterium]